MKIARTLSILLLSILSLSMNAASQSEQELREQQKLLDMLDQLDQLDQLERLDFLDAVAKANTCISIDDFFCAERALAKAGKLVNGKADKSTLLTARQDLVSARERQAEQIAREERRLAKEKRRLEREKREFEREQQRELARIRNREPVVETNAWVGVAIDAINKTSQIAQQNIENTQRIRRQQHARQKAQMEAKRRVWEREYNERVQKLNQQKNASLKLEQQRVRANQQRQQQLAKEREMREKERQRKAEKLARIQQKEREKQDRERQKEAQRVAKNRAEGAYLSKLLAGARLGVKNCYGDIAVGGQLPKITPKVVSCVDIHFRVTCPHTARSATGVIDTYVGMGTGCFGDYGKISSDLGCKVEDLRATAQKVTACN